MTEEIKDTPKTSGDNLNLKEKDVILDSAAIYVVEDDFNLDNFDLTSLASKCIGLTQGGADFKAKPTIKDIKFDGAGSKKIKGGRRVTDWGVELDVSALEMLDNIFTLSLLEKKVDSNSKYTEYVPIEGIIESSFYKNILLSGKTLAGKDAVILIRNAINTEGFNLKTEDEKEGVCKLKLEASYTLGKDFTTTEPPFIVRIIN